MLGFPESFPTKWPGWASWSQLINKSQLFHGFQDKSLNRWTTLFVSIWFCGELERGVTKINEENGTALFWQCKWQKLDINNFQKKQKCRKNHIMSLIATFNTRVTAVRDQQLELTYGYRCKMPWGPSLRRLDSRICSQKLSVHNSLSLKEQREDIRNSASH